MTTIVTAVWLPAHAQNVGKPVRVDDPTAPVSISAGNITGRPDREVTLDQDVELIRGETRITADSATYDQIENEVEAKGSVRIWRFGDRYSGEALKLNLDSGIGNISRPTYRLEINNAQGDAARVDFESEDQANVIDGTYSTCEGPDPDWYLKADTMQLDMGRDLGTASNTIVYFKGFPIMGLPAMSFPLSGQRKSGVLPPQIGIGSKGWAEVTIPYYFNIAPNRDLTLFPKLIINRGLQLGANGRYLGTSYSGETNAELLLNDQQTGENRYSIASIHTQTVAPGWSYAWNLNKASDDDYPSDFSKTITASSQRQLVRELRSDYATPLWNASVRIQNYQVLQDPGSLLNPALLVERPYARLPQLTFHTGRYDVAGFDWTLDSEMTRFWHPEKVSGNRLVVNPQVSYPFIRPGYFIKPKVSLHASQYRLDNSAVGPTSFSRVLPTVSIDSGLIFERDTSFFGQAMTQTLEPRLFYVNTPYRDQNLFPNFDTAEAGFNMAQIFSENRFTGSDRINDAKQITTGLVSRYIEASGAERLRLAVGQRFYFEQQRVVLDANTAVRNDSRSDILLAASGRLSSSITLDSALQYSETASRVFGANYGVQWQPAPKKVLNAEYRYLRNTDNALVRNGFEQVIMSGQWPVSQRWYGVARVNYSLPDRKTVDSLIGLEYRADCWTFRLVGQHFVTASQTSTSPIFIQLELNGLSKFGTNPLEALRRSIPGYQLVNQPDVSTP
ncbi:MAG: LPS-assembly protein LptD [Pseudomonadota bacterium]